MNLLTHLSTRDLASLAQSLRSELLAPPFTPLSLQHIGLPKGQIEQTARALAELTGAGMAPKSIAILLEAIRADRKSRPRLQDGLDLVMTSPEAEGVLARDTSVVVRDLFASAKESVLVSGYAVYQGKDVFQTLADRMHSWPQLNVRLFLDIQRQLGDTTPSAQIARQFASKFWQKQWPEDRPRPPLYYAPRSLEAGDKRACLHAKVIVIDGDVSFITSANLTEAAQHRNIEVGVIVKSARVGDQLVHFFDGLLQAGELQKIS